MCACAGPEQLCPADDYVAITRDLENRYGARLTIHSDEQTSVSVAGVGGGVGGAAQTMLR
jgi:hypothetical protein